MSEHHNNRLDLQGDITKEEALAGLKDQDSEHAELLRILIERERVDAKLKEHLGKMTKPAFPDGDWHTGVDAKLKEHLGKMTKPAFPDGDGKA